MVPLYLFFHFIKVHMKELMQLLRENPRAVTIKFNISNQVKDLYYRVSSAIKNNCTTRSQVKCQRYDEHMEQVASLAFEFIENHVWSKESWNNVGFEELNNIVEDYLKDEYVYWNNGTHLYSNSIKFRYLKDFELESIGMSITPVGDLINLLILTFDAILAQIDHWMNRYEVHKHAILCDYPNIYIVRLDDHRVYAYEKMRLERERVCNDD